MVSTEAPGDFPDYMEGFPQMTDDLFKSTLEIDLGWLKGLHKTANKSIDQLFGTYDFKLNPDDLLDLENLNFETFVEDSSGPIIYMSIWLAVACIFTIGGLVWCCANKCICCCRNGFKGKGSRYEDDEQHLRPYYSERNDGKHKKSAIKAIVVASFMALWLLALLLVILYAFAGNTETNNAVNDFQSDLNNGLDDIGAYIRRTISQLDHLFVQGYDEKFEKKIDEILKSCNEPPPFCDALKVQMDAAKRDAKESLTTNVRTLKQALEDVDKAVEDAKETVDGDYEDTITDSNKGLYWFLMLFNLLYCFIFALVLIGTVLAVAGKSNGMKTAGFLTTRVAIVLMFIMVIFVVCQFLVMFAFGGILTEIFCPAIRSLEEETATSPTIESNGARQSFNEYKVPTYGEIMRSCKKDESAYKAFQLENAYDIQNLREIVEKFENIDPTIPGQNVPPILENIRTQVRHYVNKIIIESVERDVGKCQPAYRAINAGVGIFCNKLPAPVISLWFILQFIPPLFLLIIITALLLERMSS